MGICTLRFPSSLSLPGPAASQCLSPLQAGLVCPLRWNGLWVGSRLDGKSLLQFVSIAKSQKLNGTQGAELETPQHAMS